MQSVQKGTAAEKAGIRGGNISGTIEGGQVAVGGDIIVSIDGKTVASSEDLANDIEAKKPGETVSIGLLRANGQRRLRTQDGERDARRTAQLRAEPEHARRLGRGPRPPGQPPLPRAERRRQPSRARDAGALRAVRARQPTAEGQDLRDHQPRTTPNWRSSWAPGRSG